MHKEKTWYQHSESESLKAQNTSLASGLSPAEVERRVVDFGLNKIEATKRKSAFRILLAQFTDLLIVILMAAAAIASWVGEPEDTIAIIAIVVLNAILGFWQEYRAERAMAALQAMAAPTAKVKRMGQLILIPAFELVPGDIVYLEAGNIIPADLRIIEAYQFGVDESALTGESHPADKLSKAIPIEQLPVADQKNMAFKGTLVTAGRAVGLVVGTGMATELGRIAKLLKEEVEVKTPLQNRIAEFAKKLSLIVIAICVIIFVVGLGRGEEPVLMFMTALSLAVAGIPEALPAVVTVALALGARTMIRRKSLVRRLPAVEALGSVTYICTDKTGTLTENRMRAQAFCVEGSLSSEISPDRREDPAWSFLIKILALNNDVTFDSKGQLQGDPTETALVQAALDVNRDKQELEKEFPRMAELPFSSERGLMSTVHKEGPSGFILTKGAPEKVLPLCTKWYGPNGLTDFSPDSQKNFIDQMASQGFRVLACAYRPLIESTSQLSLREIERDLIYVGLVGLIDPPRVEAKEAVRQCQEAGIKVVMITGDHPVTAKAIALQLGILKDDGDSVCTGQELLALTDEVLQKRIKDIRVFARVAPEQKIRIVKALQSAGEIVSMTGDGVNDAPALRRADVGVSMGKGGTDVAREASHVILLDDNFATIVAAVQEGRRIYDNIRKFVRFALSGNSGEIGTLFLAPFLGLPIPLLPIHILWVNLVTDGLPGLALAVEPAEKNIMKRLPRSPTESVFAHGLWQHTLWVGLLTAGLTLGTMAWAFHTGHSHWQSMAFTVLTLTQMGHILAIRSEHESLFSQGLRSNLPLFGAVLLTFALQMATLYIPFLNGIFKTEPLSGSELLICLAVSSVVFFAVEVEKYFRRRKNEPL